MTLDELIAEVYIYTNRPDMDALTNSTILASTLKLHGKENFYRDMKTGLLTFDTSHYEQIFSISKLARFKGLSYARKYNFGSYGYNCDISLLPPLWDNCGGYIEPRCFDAFLEIITPDNIFDEFHYVKKDVIYAAGDDLFIKSAGCLKHLLIGWMQRPNIVVGEYSSWIADEWPYAIVYDAAFTILSTTGNTDAATRFKSVNGAGLAEEQWRLVLQNNILLEAR